MPGPPDYILPSGAQTWSNDATECRQDANVGACISKPLRAEAAVFIPESAGVNHTTASQEELAKTKFPSFRPPMMELLPPNCSETGSQNAFNLTLPNFEVNHSLHQAVYDARSNLADYIQGQDVYVLKQYPWLNVLPQNWSEKDISDNDENEAETANLQRYAELDQLSKSISAPIGSGPQERSAVELKNIDEQLKAQIFMAQIAQQSRIATEKAPWSTVYPHATENAFRELTKSKLMSPNSPQHGYVGEDTLPSPRSREWQEIENATRLINLNFVEPGWQTQKWWEPPVPFGFNARARFNQPEGKINPSDSLPCGNEEDELDWINIPVKGCKYCGDDRHLTGGCLRRKYDAENMRDRCLNCNAKEHFLRDCLSPPVFDGTSAYTAKLQWYAHTEHWRQILARQHRLSHPKSEDIQHLTPDFRMSDPGLAFQSLNYTPWIRDSHWHTILSSA